MDFLDRHPTIDEWYSAFGTDAQMMLCSPEISLGAISSLPEDSCPSLGLFHECYIDPDSGADLAREWVEEQLHVINTISSAQSKLSARQIFILAADIITQYFYWNLGDVCVFLGKMRRGQWGHFYGSVDNILIMEWAAQFDKERRIELDKYEQAIAEQKKAQEKLTAKQTTISRDAYLDSLSEEDKEKSNLYALKTGKRKLFNHMPKVQQDIPTGIFRKPADLDNPPPLSEETIARRDQMLKQIEKESKQLQ